MQETCKKCDQYARNVYNMQKICKKYVKYKNMQFMHLHSFNMQNMCVKYAQYAEKYA